MTGPIDPKRFRQVMGQVPTCVTVVTAMVDGIPQAMVIGSFVSASLDPPLAAFLCTTTSSTWQELRRADTLGVNVLGADQVDISNACMRPPLERLEGLEWKMVDGAPQILDSAAWMTLEHHRIIDAGDHELALCRVISMDMPDEPHEPLVFFSGRYRRLGPEEH